MKIFVATNSYYLKKDKIDFIIQNFSLEKIINLDIYEDFELIQNLYKYNLLKQPILYVVDLTNITKLTEKKLNTLITLTSSNYICFYTNEISNKNVNKLKASCEFEYITYIKNLHDKIEYLAVFCAKISLNASYEVLKYLLIRCASNLDIALNEAQKLQVYYQNEEIYNKHVNLFVKDIRQDSLFDFYALIFTNNNAKKLEFINSFIQSANIIPLFNGLKNYIYLSYQVKILLNENNDIVSIAKQVNKHEFYIQNICKSLTRVTLKQIEEYNDKLINIDLNLKQTNFNLKQQMYQLI